MKKTGAFFPGMQVGNLVLTEFKSADDLSEHWNALDSESGQHLSITIQVDRQGAFRHFNDKRQDNLQAGLAIADYTLGKQIGVGTTADIWQAQSQNNDDTVVLKIFNSTSQKFFLQFRQEIRILQQHQDIGNISRLLNYHISDTIPEEIAPFCWYAMPLLNKTHLFNQNLQRVPQQKKLLLQLMSCLQSLHQAGIYYYEIKGDHLLVDSEGDLSLIDFGTSIVINTIQDEVIITQKREQYIQQTVKDCIKLLSAIYSEADLKFSPVKTSINTIIDLESFFVKVRKRLAAD